MKHRALPVLKFALMGLLITGLIAACGGPSAGTKSNDSSGSAARPVSGQSNPSDAAASNGNSSNAAPASVNPQQPAAPVPAAQPNVAPSDAKAVNPVNPAAAQSNIPAANPNDGSAVQAPAGGSAVQSPAGGTAAVSNDDAKGDAADQALNDLENSLNSVDTIDDLK